MMLVELLAESLEWRLTFISARPAPTPLPRTTHPHKQSLGKAERARYENHEMIAYLNWTSPLTRKPIWSWSTRWWNKVGMWGKGDRLGSVSALHREIHHLAEHDALDEAGIGRGQQHHLRKDIRGDAIHWLDKRRRSGANTWMLWQSYNSLSMTLFLGLFEYEAHLLTTLPEPLPAPLGQLRGGQPRDFHRRLFEPDWPSDGGGEMVIYHPDDPTLVARVVPEAGTFACFLSETIPHEVLPTRQPRAAHCGLVPPISSAGRRIRSCPLIYEQ